MARSHGSSKGAKNIICLIFSFFLSLMLVADLMLVIGRFGVLSRAGFMAAFDDAYYQYALDAVNEQARYYTLPTGIDPSVLDGVFTVEEVRGDVAEYVDRAFNGIEEAPDVSAPSQRLSANVRAFFEANEAEMNEETEQIVASYVSEIMDVYREVVKIPGLDAIAKVRGRIVMALTVCFFGCTALSIVLVIALVRMHRFPHRGLRYVAYATGGAFLMSLLAPLAIRMSGAYKGLGLSPQYFYHFGISFIERILSLCLMGSGVFLVVTVILWIVIARKRSRVARHSSSRHHFDEDDSTYTAYGLYDKHAR